MSVSGVSANSNMEMLAVAMMKKQTDAEGEAALQLLNSTVQSVQQVNQTAAQVQASASSRIGSLVNTTA